MTRPFRHALAVLGALALVAGTATLAAPLLGLAHSSFVIREAATRSPVPKDPARPPGGPESGHEPLDEGTVTLEATLHDGGEIGGLLLFAIGIVLVGLAIRGRGRAGPRDGASVGEPGPGGRDASG